MLGRDFKFRDTCPCGSLILIRMDTVLSIGKIVRSHSLRLSGCIADLD